MDDVHKSGGALGVKKGLSLGVGVGTCAGKGEVAGGNVLVLSGVLEGEVCAQMEAVYPEEGCGVMYGRDEVGVGGGRRRVVEAVEGAANVAEAGEGGGRGRRFVISARALMAAEKRAAAEGRAVVGFYHSHPDGVAVPSEVDREAGWPYYSYVIVAVEDGVSGEVASWVLDEGSGGFVREAVVRG